MDNFICKIATLDEMNEKWDYEINNAIEDKDNWIIWKENNIKNFQDGKIIPYYGILNGKIICEGTVHITSDTVQNSEALVSSDTAYLSAFRTIKEYQGKGYFSVLFEFMINDLRKKGYKYITLGVEPEEEKNKAIYSHYGFNKLIKIGQEQYPDGTTIDVEYYKKHI